MDTPEIGISGTRQSSRYAGRHGAAPVFSGRVRKWRRRWIPLKPGGQLRVLKWVPLPQQGSQSPETRRPRKYIPLTLLLELRARAAVDGANAAHGSAEAREDAEETGASMPREPPDSEGRAASAKEAGHGSQATQSGEQQDVAERETDGSPGVADGATGDLSGGSGPNHQRRVEAADTLQPAGLGGSGSRGEEEEEEEEERKAGEGSGSGSEGGKDEDGGYGSYERSWGGEVCASRDGAGRDECHSTEGPQSVQLGDEQAQEHSGEEGRLLIFLRDSTGAVRDAAR